MPRRTNRRAIRHCYSTWSESYHRDYYGAKAAYPPVHRDRIIEILKDAKAKRVLDAGCGPASFLRELEGFDRYGFDLTPEMVEEGNRVLETQGETGERIWIGDVARKSSFRGPRAPRSYDAAVCIGVLPHIPERSDRTVISNLRDAVRRGGTVVVEARNALFSLFTFNRYSFEFFLDELLPVRQLKRTIGGRSFDRLVRELQERFFLDLPPTRKGKWGEPGYDEVLSRAHNPLVLRDQFAAEGFDEVRLVFYHYHALPPFLWHCAPNEIQRESLRMERSQDWRGYFMASAFLLSGRKR